KSMRRSRTLLGVALALALGAAPARAAAPPPRAAGPPARAACPPLARPPADALDAIQDMRLRVLARRALDREAALAELKLGIEVRRSVAVLSGVVPSVAAARLALERVEAINGILEVRSELRTGMGESLADLSVPARASRNPLKVQAAKPIGPGVLEPSLATVSGAGMKVARPGTLPPPRPVPASVPSRPAERGLEVLPPTVKAAPSPAGSGADVRPARVRQEGGAGRFTSQQEARPASPAPQPSAVAEAVAKVASAPPFRAIPVRVNGGVVVISRKGADEDAVSSLFQALRRVSGVKEVRLSDD